MNISSPIKILHVVGAMNQAGTETMLMNIYRNIDRDKVHFDFISYSNQDAHYDAEIRKMGGQVIKLSKTQSIQELYEAIKKHGPYSAVHAHTLFHCGTAVLAAKLAGVKIRIAHAHTTSDKNDTLVRRLYIKSMRFLINTFSTDLLSCSNEAARYLFGENKLNKANYKYFPNLIDYAKFLSVKQEEISRFKAEEGLDEGLVIGHIGRFIEPKNHRFLLDIIKCLAVKNQNTKLLLVGDGDLRTQTEEAARKEGVYENIRFLGLRNDIPVMLHSMDVFVFPSKYEGLGLVMLEAQAAGLPCIVSEAIQPEADLKINLVSRLSLSTGAKVWADKILERAGRKERDTNKIVAGFEKNGYSLPEGIAKLMALYQIAREDV